MRKLIQRMRRKQAFTLVELMIVVTIVAILALIAIPLYSANTTAAIMSEGVAGAGTIRTALRVYFSQKRHLHGPRFRRLRNAADRRDRPGRQVFRRRPTTACSGVSASTYLITAGPPSQDDEGRSYTTSSTRTARSPERTRPTSNGAARCSRATLPVYLRRTRSEQDSSENAAERCVTLVELMIVVTIVGHPGLDRHSALFGEHDCGDHVRRRGGRRHDPHRAADLLLPERRVHRRDDRQPSVLGPSDLEGKYFAQTDYSLSGVSASTYLVTAGPPSKTTRTTLHYSIDQNGSEQGSYYTNQ